jgi:hypothetical protein
MDSCCLHTADRHLHSSSLLLCRCAEELAWHDELTAKSCMDTPAHGRLHSSASARGVMRRPRSQMSLPGGLLLPDVLSLHQAPARMHARTITLAGGYKGIAALALRCSRRLLPEYEGAAKQQPTIPMLGPGRCKVSTKNALTAPSQSFGPQTGQPCHDGSLPGPKAAAQRKCIVKDGCFAPRSDTQPSPW